MECVRYIKRPYAIKDNPICKLTVSNRAKSELWRCPQKPRENEAVIFCENFFAGGAIMNSKKKVALVIVGVFVAVVAAVVLFFMFSGGKKSVSVSDSNQSGGKPSVVGKIAVSSLTIDDFVDKLKDDGFTKVEKVVGLYGKDVKKPNSILAYAPDGKLYITTNATGNAWSSSEKYSIDYEMTKTVGAITDSDGNYISISNFIDAAQTYADGSGDQTFTDGDKEWGEFDVSYSGLAKLVDHISVDQGVIVKK